MMRICSDCGRPMGEDMEKPVKGHCYGLWFADWQATDCWQIASARYARTPSPGVSRSEHEVTGLPFESPRPEPQHRDDGGGDGDDDDGGT